MTAPKLSVVGPASRHSLAKTTTTPIGRLREFTEQLERREFSPKTIAQYVREVERAEWWCEQAGHTLLKVPAIVLAQYVEARPKPTPPARTCARRCPTTGPSSSARTRPFGCYGSPANRA